MNGLLQEILQSHCLQCS